MYDQFEGIVINKPMGVINKPIDLRSNIWDPDLGDYRDYFTVAEALAELTGETPEHTAAIRSGHFPIYVTPVEGGDMLTYWFPDGTEDDDIVLMFSGNINEGDVF